MLRSRFFWRLFGVLVVQALALTVILGALFLRQLDRTWVADHERSLRDQCVLLAPYAAAEFAGQDFAELEAEMRRIAAALGVRVTLIRRDGGVYLDTVEEAARMENHLGRPEVQEALVSGFGMDQRMSRTLGVLHKYVAYAPPSAANSAGVVRLALPVAELDRRHAQLVRKTLVVAGLVCLGMLALAYVLARRVTAPIAAITHAALGFREGRYETRLGGLPNDEIGELGRVMNQMGVEVTDKIRAITAEEAKLRAMLAGMVEGVIAVDDADRVAFSNLAACRLFRVSREQLVGKPLWEVVRLPGLDALLVGARDQEGAAERELVLSRDTSGEYVLMAKAHRYVVEDSIGVVIVFEDVTELRRLEVIRRDFVANVSHELKTPLTSIRGYVETLIDGAVDDKQHNQLFLQKIDRNVQRLNALVSDLLSLARIEAEEGSLSLVRVDLRPVVQRALRRAEELARGQGSQVQAELPAGKTTARADEEALTQVLDNLLDNAIKYTPAGGRVDLRVRQLDDQIELTVTDTGIGIPSVDLERIFERFYRVDKARSREVGGTGLGLSIVKHLVQAMGGEVRVTSQKGRGSCFTVLLQRAD